MAWYSDERLRKRIRKHIENRRGDKNLTIEFINTTIEAVLEKLKQKDLTISSTEEADGIIGELLKGPMNNLTDVMSVPDLPSEVLETNYDSVPIQEQIQKPRLEDIKARVEKYKEHTKKPEKTNLKRVLIAGGIITAASIVGVTIAKYFPGQGSYEEPEKIATGTLNPQENDLEKEVKETPKIPEEAVPKSESEYPTKPEPEEPHLELEKPEVKEPEYPIEPKLEEPIIPEKPENQLEEKVKEPEIPEPKPIEEPKPEYPTEPQEQYPKPLTEEPKEFEPQPKETYPQPKPLTEETNEPENQLEKQVKETPEEKKPDAITLERGTQKDGPLTIAPHDPEKEQEEKRKKYENTSMYRLTSESEKKAKQSKEEFDNTRKKYDKETSTRYDETEKRIKEAYERENKKLKERKEKSEK